MPARFYVVYDDVHDYRFYQMLHEWKEDPDIDFDFLPSDSLCRSARSTQVAPISPDLPLVVLIGRATRYLGYVESAILKAIGLQMPIIGVNLNGMRFQDNDQCPNILQGKLAVHIEFNRLILNLALKTWPEYHRRFVKEQKFEPHYYGEDHYTDLGLQ